MAVFHLEESEIVLVQFQEMMDEIKTEVEDILSQPDSFKVFVQEYFFIYRLDTLTSNPRRPEVFTAQNESFTVLLTKKTKFKSKKFDFS